MPHLPLLANVLVILALTVGVVLVFSRLRLPPVVGLLLTGVLAGPAVFGAVRSATDVEAFAEIGVILLLFTIGLEYSLRDLVRIRGAVLGGGSMQVGFTIAVTVLVAIIFGTAWRVGVFYGFLAALSSTAIVLKVLQDRAETDTPQGRTILGILIFQDIAVVPMMLVVPLLAGGEGETGLHGFLIMLGKGAVLVAGVIVAARFVVPHLLYLVARTRVRELFLITIVLLCFAIAWGTSELGLSLALGAFLAGLIISESEYSHHALGNILPFRDVFTSFFFVSIGMLFDPRTIIETPVPVLAVTIGVIVFKALAAGAAAAFLRLPLRTAVLVGVSLAQIGEFSFILSKIGLGAGLLDASTYQIFLAASILSLAATPPLMALAPRIAGRLPLRERPVELPAELTALDDHLIVIGYGVNGRNLARTARSAGIRYIIVEMNARTVREEAARGEPIVYGDASSDAVLEHVGVERARVVVVAISDAAATRRIVERVHRLNPLAHLIARTRYTLEVPPLQHLGADEVIPEEFETSVEIFTRVLRRYFVPETDIDVFAAEIRADGYQMLRRPDAPVRASHTITIPDIDVTHVRVGEGARATHCSLATLNLRRTTGATVLSVQRGEVHFGNPDGDLHFAAGDVVMLIGSLEQLAAARGIFEGGSPDIDQSPHSEADA